MADSTTSTYEWLKQLPSAVLKMDETPLLGYPPPFPWDQLSEKLAKLFEIPSLTVAPSQTFEWRSPEEISEGFGDHPIPLHFTVTPLGGDICWLMAEEDIRLLMSLLLTNKPELIAGIDPDFEQAFYHFIAIETIYTISQVDFDKAFSALLLENQDLPQEPSLCHDLIISVYDKTLSGRLVISPTLQHKWKERYAQRTLALPLANKLDLTIHLEIGKVELDSQTWTNIKPGDFLLLDSCSLKPNGEGSVMLTTHGLPLFRATLDNGQVVLQDYPSYQE